MRIKGKQSYSPYWMVIRRRGRGRAPFNAMWKSIVELNYVGGVIFPCISVRRREINGASGAHIFCGLFVFSLHFGGMKATKRWIFG